MAVLFSYVVDHDLGFAPNPYGGYCTLVHCKFGGLGGKRNIVELAEEQDWVLGSGGQSKQSAGNGKIVYLMRVDEKLSFKEYLADSRFQERSDCIDRGSGNLSALVSWTYFYFGGNALPLSDLPASLAAPRLLKTGIGFRRDLPEATLKRLVAWFMRNFEIGMHAEPCASHCDYIRQCKRRNRRYPKRPLPFQFLGVRAFSGDGGR